MFTRGILQALDLVQVMVIQLLVKRLKSASDIGEIHDPARLLLHSSSDANLDAERMAVQTPALVILWNIRQVMCRLDGKLLEYFHTNSRTKSDRTSLTTFAGGGNRTGDWGLATAGVRR